MDKASVEREIRKLETTEKSFKKLYVANPYDQIGSVASWNEFEYKYKKNMSQHVDFPKKPLIEINNRFFENQFFQNKENVQQNRIINPPKQNSDIDVYKHYRYAPIMIHSLEFVKICYVFSGVCNFYVGRTMTQLKQGTLIIVSPNTEQAFFCNDDNDIVINIIMRASTFQEMFSPLLMEQGDFVDFFVKMIYQKNFSKIVTFDCGDDSDIRSLILDLFEESKLTSRGSTIILNSYVLLLFGKLIRKYANKLKILTGHRHKEKISNIIFYISQNYHQLTLSECAAHFNFSTGYLSRYIKAETGLSFRGLIREYKMKESLRLLEKTDISVEQIGYVDVTHFYTIFKDKYGVTPATFRNNLR